LQEAYYTREVRACCAFALVRVRALTRPASPRPQYTVEEKERGLDMPAKLFASNTLNERSKHGSNAALAQLDKNTPTPA
jgi:hypothetical protein